MLGDIARDECFDQEGLATPILCRLAGPCGCFTILDSMYCRVRGAGSRAGELGFRCARAVGGVIRPLFGCWLELGISEEPPVVLFQLL